FLDVDQSRSQPGDQRRQRDPAGAVVVVAVFDEAGEDIGEGIFAADADGPSRARFGSGIDGPEDDGRGRVIVALPGAAAPDIAEEAIPGVAGTTVDRRQRLGLAVIGDADLARAVMAARGVGPGIVALHADHEAAGELIVATGLYAAEPAIRLMSAEPRAKKSPPGVRLVQSCLVHRLP